MRNVTGSLLPCFPNARWEEKATEKEVTRMEQEFKFSISVGTVKTIVMIFVMLLISVVIIYYLLSLSSTLIDDEEAQNQMANITDKFILAVGVVMTVVIISVLLLLFKVFGKK
jgi:uncharacterized protein YqhQ